MLYFTLCLVKQTLLSQRKDQKSTKSGMIIAVIIHCVFCREDNVDHVPFLQQKDYSIRRILMAKGLTGIAVKRYFLAVVSNYCASPSCSPRVHHSESEVVCPFYRRCEDPCQRRKSIAC